MYTSTFIHDDDDDNVYDGNHNDDDNDMIGCLCAQRGKYRHYNALCCPDPCRQFVWKFISIYRKQYNGYSCAFGVS